MAKDLETWERGWKELCDEAKIRGRYSGVSTTALEVPYDLWNRILAYPDKPSELNKIIDYD